MARTPSVLRSLPHFRFLYKNIHLECVPYSQPLEGRNIKRIYWVSFENRAPRILGTRGRKQQRRRKNLQTQELHNGCTSPNQIMCDYYKSKQAAMFGRACSMRENGDGCVGYPGAKLSIGAWNVWRRGGTAPSFLTSALYGNEQCASELYRPSDRGLLASHGRILGFLDRSRYFFFQVAPQLYTRGWVDPVPDPLLLRKSGSRESNSDL
jgi:hypothetical protein